MGVGVMVGVVVVDRESVGGGRRSAHHGMASIVATRMFIV